ncbi:MAG TPA: nicotinate-nucleotide--dimethylbenzimidazole phosphoribosyltransferase [Streptosporangiaceae bacterium]|nr:nicotinate-nucleotide--dimethylbenzimidazole phosphoribosyltransferase [Streptosporangiaceae bacterium]
MNERSFVHAARTVMPVDMAAAQAAAVLHNQLTKPAGSLGQLEKAGIQLAGIAGRCPPPVPEPVTVAVFAADHGVAAEGVTAWPQEVTAQMVANFCAGGAAINVLARHAGAEVIVVDVGVATPLGAETPGLLQRVVRPGTGNIAVEPAMTPEEARSALDVGAGIAAQAAGRGARMLVTGDMGIGNTTASAAVIAAITGLPAAEVTGRGAGADDAVLARKTEVVERARQRVPAQADPLLVLAELGGLEIAALAGFIVGGAASRLPVVADGVIACAAALIAAALVPAAGGYLIGGHRSSEPGATAALAHLGIEPLLDLQMRLGEGSGATLAVPLVQAAAKVLGEMATFDSAGVAGKQPPA